MSQIEPNEVLTVDYETKNISENVCVHFCVIKMKNGEKFRHEIDISDELQASNMADKIYCHVVNDRKNVDISRWKKHEIA